MDQAKDQHSQVRQVGLKSLSERPEDLPFMVKLQVGRLITVELLVDLTLESNRWVEP